MLTDRTGTAKALHLRLMAPPRIRRAAAPGLAVLAALALLAPGSAVAQTTACPAAPPRVTVALEMAEPSIDNSLPQLALQRLAGPAHHEGRTQGLYRATLTWRRTLRFGRSNDCRWLEAAQIDIRLAPRVIYVTRQRVPGTCPYESVLTHERKHQAVDEELLGEYRPLIENAVTAAIAALQSAPQAAATPEAPLAHAVDAALQRVMGSLTAARMKRQAAVDNPKEYRRVRAACG